MPIRKSEKSRYPKNWKAIRVRILKRAENCCEGSPSYPECRAENYARHPETGSKVVLTIAHLDHTPENCVDENLKAWCQRCHLRYDSSLHARNAKITRLKRSKQKTFIDPKDLF